MQPNCSQVVFWESFGWFFHAEHKQRQSLELGTVTEELTYYQQYSFLIYFLVKLYFVCVTSVEAKAVADYKYVHGICSVVFNEFKKHTFTCWVKFSQLKTLMTVSI